MTKMPIYCAAILKDIMLYMITRVALHAMKSLIYCPLFAIFFPSYNTSVIDILLSIFLKSEQRSAKNMSIEKDIEKLLIFIWTGGTNS